MTTTIFVCDTCNYSTDMKLLDGKSGGEMLAEHIEQLAAEAPEIEVRRQSCLMGCARRQRPLRRAHSVARIVAELTLILGGARSGKTAHALAASPAPHCYIATAQALDGEMADRIAAHKAERGATYHTRDIDAETAALITAARAAPGRIVMVSNEVGLGLVPMEKLSRDFRDAQGRLNQRIAAAADHVRFIAAGLPLILKGNSDGAGSL